MAEQIVLWCDTHLALDQKVDAHKVTLTLDGVNWRIDLCPECDEKTLGLLRALLEDRGQRLKAGSPSAPGPTVRKIDLTETSDGRRGKQPNGGRPLVCLSCGKDYSTMGGLAGHFCNEHGHKNDLVIGDIYGSTCPACEAPFASFGAMSMHASRTHGEPAVPLFARVLAEGDPYGIVKGTIERIEMGALVS